MSDRPAPQARSRWLDPTDSQRTARLGGLLLLLTLAVQIAGELLLRAPLIAGADAARTARNLVESERLFRGSVVVGLVGVAGQVGLLVVLYWLLAPFGERTARLAAGWRGVGAAVLAQMALLDLLALRLLGGAADLRVLPAGELQALVRLFLSAHHLAGVVGNVFLTLGAGIFAWLWLKSAAIPRALAILGLSGAAVLLSGLLVLSIWPEWTSSLSPGYWMPQLGFEVTLGLWLLARGLSSSAHRPHLGEAS